MRDAEKIKRVEKLREQIRDLVKIHEASQRSDVAEKDSLVKSIVEQHYDAESRGFVDALVDFLRDGGRVSFSFCNNSDEISGDEYPDVSSVVGFVKSSSAQFHRGADPFDILDELLMKLDSSGSLDNIVEAPADLRVLIVEAIVGIVRHGQSLSGRDVMVEDLCSELIGMCNRHIKIGKPGFAHGLSRSHDVFQDTWLEFSEGKISQIEEKWL